VTVARASDRLDQADALIVAQSVRGHSAPLCHASDGVASVSHNFNLQLGARSKSTRLRGTRECLRPFCDQLSI
jgi:hypothetical protein